VINRRNYYTESPFLQTEVVALEQSSSVRKTVTSNLPSTSKRLHSYLNDNNTNNFREMAQQPLEVRRSTLPCGSISVTPDMPAISSDPSRASNTLSERTHPINRYHVNVGLENRDFDLESYKAQREACR